MRRLGELEAEAMDRLWRWARPTLVREVVDDLQPDRPLAYTTVMTVMDNLYRKGLLRREREGRAYRYEPVCTREEYSAGLMSEALGASSDRGATLLRFVEHISDDEVALLRQAFDAQRPQ